MVAPAAGASTLTAVVAPPPAPLDRSSCGRRRLRVVHVITRYTHGGSEQRLRDVLAAVDADHHVVVGRDSDERRVDELRDRAEVTWLPSLVRSVHPPSDARVVPALVSAFRRARADVVHTHQAKGGLLGRLAARLARTPAVFHSASMASFGPGYGRWESRAFALAERVTAPLVDRYFVVGDDLAQRLIANGVSPARLELVRSSLDLADFRAPTADEQAKARAALGLDPATPVLCYVGSLEERKGVLLLPQLLEFVRRVTDEDVQLVVAGTGPLRAQLAAEAEAALGPGAVTLLGHVPHVAEVMRAADALVLPSAAEGLPQVLVQAAASRLPFAAYRVDGVEEMRRLGAIGWAVELGDRRGLALATISALATGRRDRASGVDRTALAPWSPSEVQARYARAYDAVAVTR